MVDSSRFTLSFSFAGIPTTIRPTIWIVLLILGSAGSTSTDLSYPLAFMVLGVLSLLVHEYGHAFCAKAFGLRVLGVELGNLGGVTRTEEKHHISRRQELLIVLSGAGTALAAAAVVGAFFGLLSGDIIGGILSSLLLPFSALVPQAQDVLIPTIQPFLEGITTLDPSLRLWQGFFIFTTISVIWSLFNLLPILPLDGGKALTLLLNNAKQASFAGVITASLILFWTLMQMMIFTFLIIGWLLFVNWRVYRSFSQES